jgi:hypothetical protein
MISSPGLDVTGESVSECRPTEHAGESDSANDTARRFCFPDFLSSLDFGGVEDEALPKIRHYVVNIKLGRRLPQTAAHDECVRKLGHGTRSMAAPPLSKSTGIEICSCVINHR